MLKNNYQNQPEAMIFILAVILETQSIPMNGQTSGWDPASFLRELPLNPSATLFVRIGVPCTDTTSARGTY